MIETYKLTKGSDTINVIILDDGTIKTETDKISAPNHSSAEAFLAWVSKMTGGVTKRVGRGKSSQTHTHQHGETHSH
jgi:hypothetical protein